MHICGLQRLAIVATSLRRLKAGCMHYWGMNVVGFVQTLSFTSPPQQHYINRNRDNYDNGNDCSVLLDKNLVYGSDYVVRHAAFTKVYFYILIMLQHYIYLTCVRNETLACKWLYIFLFLISSSRHSSLVTNMFFFSID